MTRSRCRSIGWTALAIACAVALGFAIRRALASDIYGLAASIQDDSFYYLLPAFNFSHMSPGEFTFDGEHPTYGFQPLYMLLLAAAAPWFSDLYPFLRFAVALNALLHCITVVAIYAILERALEPTHPAIRSGFALLGAGYYLTHITVFLASTTVKENALAATLLAAAILATLRLYDQPSTRDDARSARTAVLIGLLLAALVLTRILPTTLLVVAVLGFVVWRRCRHRVLATACAAVPILLWTAFAWSRFGHVIPTSGLVKASGLEAGLPQAGAATLLEMAVTARDLLVAILGLALNREIPFWIPQADAPWMGAAGAAVTPDPHAALRWILVGLGGAGALSGGRSLLHRVPLARLGGALALAVVLGHGLTLLLLWPERGQLFYATWYYYALPVLLPLLLAASAGDLAERIRSGLAVRPPPARSGQWAMGATAVAVLVATLVVFSRLHPLGAPDFRVRTWQNVMIRSALLLRDKIGLGEEARVAAFNSGALGFVLRGRVVNLDGLANDSVLREPPSWRQYLEQARVTHYVDAIPPERLGVEHRILRTLPTWHADYPTYYIARIEPAAGISGRPGREDSERP